MRARPTSGEWRMRRAAAGDVGRVRPSRMGRTVKRSPWSFPTVVVMLAWIAAAAASTAGALPSEGVSQPFLLGGSVTTVPAVSDQRNPAAACDTSGAGIALVVWEDDRAGDADIFAIRCDGAGLLLDPTPFVLAAGAAQETNPAVACGAGEFLVAWRTVLGSMSAIEVARVSLDGSLLGSFVIASGRGAWREPVVSFDGEKFLVVWVVVEDPAVPQAVLHGARISPSGTVLDPQPFIITSATDGASIPAVGFDGKRYLIVWSQVTHSAIHGKEETLHGDIRGLFLSTEGNLGGPFTVSAARIISGTDTTDANELNPAVTTDGTNFLVTWMRDDRYVYGHLIDSTGTAVEVQRPIRLIETVGSRGRPWSAYDGESYLVCWPLLVGPQGTTGIRALRVSPLTGAPREGAPFTVRSEPSQGVSVTWTGSTYLVASASRPASELDILGTLIQRSGQVSALAAPTLSVSTPQQIPGGMLYDGNQYIAVWEEQTQTGWQVLGACISTEGEVQAPGAFTLIPSAANRHNPTVVAGSDAHLLLRSARQGSTVRLMATPIGASGTALGPEVVVGDAMDECHPSAAWDGENFFVVWRSYADTPSGPRWGVRGCGMHYAGGALTIVDSMQYQFYYSGGPCSDAAVAFDGEKYLVVWAQEGLGFLRSLMWPTGTVPAGPIPIGIGSPSATPCLTFDGSRYLLTANVAGTVYGVRLSRSGVVLDPGGIRVASETLCTDRAAGASDGNAPVVVWRSPQGGSWEILGSRLAPSGEMLDAGGLQIAAEAPTQRYPFVAAGPAGQLLIGYASLLTEDGFSSLRLAARIWSQQRPELEMTVHQNPGVTSDIAVHLFPSEPLAEGTLALYANGEPLETDLIDADHGIYRGWYRATGSVTVTLRATARDLAGNLGEGLRAFALGAVTPLEGGSLTGPYGLLSLRCPSHAVAEDAFVMILPDRSWRAPESGESAADEWSFVVSPAELVMERPLVLSFEAPEVLRGEDGAPRVLVLERETADGWVPLAVEGVHPDRLTASVSALGHFRVRWAQSAPAGGGHLMLRQGPEPFRGDLSIRYTLPRAGHVELAVYDIGGRRVQSLVDAFEAAGPHTLDWDGRDAGGRRLGSGVYFTRFTFENQTWTRRSVLVR